MNSFRHWYFLVIFILFFIGFFYVRGVVLPRQDEMRFYREQQQKSDIGLIRATLLIGNADPVSIQAIDDVEFVRRIHPGFYMNAKKGDIVYTFQEMVVLFRPDTKEIIEYKKSSHQ